MRYGLAIGAAGLAAGLAAAADFTKDTLADIQKAVAAGSAVLVDVREPAEWDAGHLKDARPLPLGRLRDGVPAAELAKVAPEGKVVYTHCVAGVRAKEAAAVLKANGYDARPLKAGYTALIKAGFAPAPKEVSR